MNKTTRLYVQFIDDIDNLKNSTYCIALCEMKYRIELEFKRIEAALLNI